MTTQKQRERDDGKVRCPNDDCGELFANKGLSHHWRQSGCEYPNFTDEQNDIIKGRMLGDGSVNTTSNKNPYFRFRGISWPYLEWLDDKFVCLTTGVKVAATAEKLNEVDSTYSDNHCDYYRVCTRSIPCINKYDEWYELDENGERYCPFPDSIELTPTIFKHWYISDFSINRGGKRPHMIFNSNKAIGNIDTLHSYFDPLPVELVVSTINEDKYGNECQGFRFSADDSEWLWDWMGDPVYGYEYKWPEGPTYEEWKEMIRTTTDRYGTPPRYRNETVVKKKVTETKTTVEKTIEREIIATDGGNLTQSDLDDY